jgi:hypothetical protein
VSGARMSGAIALLPYTPSWRGQGQVYIVAGLNEHVSVCFIPAIFRSSLQEYKRDYIRYIRYIRYMPISVAVRSMVWVCSRSLAGIAGSNPAGDMDVSRECCAWSGRSLCDGLITLSREVLPSVVCLRVIVKPRQCGGRGPLGTVEP